jgi:hypothetical protein
MPQSILTLNIIENLNLKMKKLFLLILILSFNVYSQDSLRVNQVYFEKGLLQS